MKHSRWAFVAVVATVGVQALGQGVPANPGDPIEGQLSPGYKEVVSGTRWSTELWITDWDNYVVGGDPPQFYKVCNNQVFVAPYAIPSHEPTAEHYLTVSGWANCKRTFIHSKVAKILPPETQELFIDKYIFSDGQDQYSVLKDADMLLEQQVLVKGPQPQPPIPPPGQ